MTGPFALDVNVVTARKGKRQKERKRKRYALVLTRTGPDLFSWRGDSGDSCTGQTFRSPDRTAPFAPFGCDFVFTVFVSA